MAGRDLAHNDIDIESTLFGVGSTNLEKSTPIIDPIIKSYPSVNVMTKLPIVVPQPFSLDNNQRPMYLN
jgi:hypothetical protein